MALEFADTLANARADSITSARDDATGAGKIRVYSGVRPSKGGAATTLLAELLFSTTSAPAASVGVLTASSITGDPSADASGEATWFREVDGDNVFIMDGGVGLAASSTVDLVLNDVNIVTGQPVSITSYVNTEGNL